jgi:hypothetical protein
MIACGFIDSSTNVYEEHSASIVCPEDGANTLLRNLGTISHVHSVTQETDHSQRRGNIKSHAALHASQYNS